MGYTHYLRRKPDAEGDWGLFADCVRELLSQEEAKGVSFADGVSGEGTKPVVDGNQVWFNGAGQEGYETCMVEREPRRDFEFCKTAYKPYDEAVAATYALADVLLGCEMSSDGGDEVVAAAKGRAADIIKVVKSRREASA